MAFDIVLQYNQSEKERVTKNVTDISTVSGNLKQPTSIIDPVFIVEADLEDVANVNYLTVEQFGRKYFVNNVRSIRTGLVEFSCHVDVLSSFETQIKANKAIVEKQEKRWNLYLNDGTFKVYQNPTVLTKAFPSGFNTMEYVMAIAGS